MEYRIFCTREVFNDLLDTVGGLNILSINSDSLDVDILDEQVLSVLTYLDSNGIMYFLL